MKKSVYLLILFLFTTWPIHPLPATQPQGKPAHQEKIKNLELLIKSIDHVSKKLAEVQSLLQSPRGIGREQELRSQINELSLKLKDLETTFAQLSSEVDLGEFREEKKKGVDWDEELTELLSPLIRETRKLTVRPREIEKLRSNTERYKSQLEVIEKASKNLSALLSQAGNPQLIEKLNSTIKVWENRKREITTQMNIAVQQLEQKLGKRKPLSQSVQEVLKIFFKSRGRNLMLAFVAFVFVWFVLRYIHRLIQKFSPLHKIGRAFYVRVFDMIYIILTVILSILALLGVLYSFGDWVLLSIAIIFALGIGWASKQAIPRFWRQATLLLNLGPVREGEVVVYNGLPYEVASINLSTELKNRGLEGGYIRLPLKDLTELRSRPIFQDEPWFPSRRGDWVKLSDGTHGKVVAQSPEIVELELLGGASKTYTTMDYLSQSPMNLSSGYRLWITFGLDYAHQAIITREIPAIFEKAIIDDLTVQGHGDSINRIRVEFEEAGASSLDLAVLADFKGNAGSKYSLLSRAIQRICVDTCNVHHWVIPFQQVTVHVAEPSDHPE
jgi:hypothetical protein